MVLGFAFMCTQVNAQYTASIKSSIYVERPSFMKMSGGYTAPGLKMKRVGMGLTLGGAAFQRL